MFQRVWDCPTYSERGMNSLKISGLLFYLSGAIVLMGIITAEAMNPRGYTTFGNEISDLGATK